MTTLYHPGTSVVHRLPAGPKVLAVCAAGTLLFVTRDLRVLAAAGLGVLGLVALARVPWHVAVAQVRPALVMVVLVGAAQWVAGGWRYAVVVCLRLTILLVLAALVTVTTRVSAMVAAMERALRPLAVVGVRTAGVGLAISLTLRFIPMLTRVVHEVREAQRARGLERSTLALAVPVVVRTLRMADHLAEAIDARSGGA